MAERPYEAFAQFSILVMPLLRKTKLIQHTVERIAGEPGRYRVESSSAADEHYNVDVETDECPCKGWSVRKWCTHLNSAHAYHAAQTAK